MSLSHGAVFSGHTAEQDRNAHDGAKDPARNFDKMHAAKRISFDVAIVIAPSQLFREGLKTLLSGLDIQISAEAKNLEEAMGKLAQGAQPSLIIYSVEPGIPTEELQQLWDIRSRFPEVKIVLLADNMSPTDFQQAIRGGIDAILFKDISRDVLQHSLELVSLGQQFFPSSMAQGLLQNIVFDGDQDRSYPQMAQTRPGSSETERTLVLSARERQILRGLVNGLSNKVIARELDIAEATVKVHVKGLLRKVRVLNRTQMAIWAMNHGFEVGSEPISAPMTRQSLPAMAGRL